MGKRPKKHVIIFLVEGESEKDALWGPFEALMDEYAYQGKVEIRFGHIKDEDGGLYGGDITSKSGICPGNIVKNINNLMLSWVFNTDHIYPKDVIEVIHLVDLDGAYIPDSNILPEVADDTAKNRYINDTIITRDPQKTIERNERKRANIDYLTAMSEIKIWQGYNSKIVPYSVYYFSSNLDHYLHDNANIETSREKRERARKFSDRSIDDLNYFIKTFIDDPDGICDLDYKASWDYIREGTNSVNRHSNLGVLIKKVTENNN